MPFYGPVQLSLCNCRSPGISSMLLRLCWETQQTLLRPTYRCAILEELVEKRILLNSSRLWNWWGESPMSRWIGGRKPYWHDQEPHSNVIYHFQVWSFNLQPWLYFLTIPVSHMWYWFVFVSLYDSKLFYFNYSFDSGNSGEKKLNRRNTSTEPDSRWMPSAHWLGQGNIGEECKETKSSSFNNCSIGCFNRIIRGKAQNMGKRKCKVKDM